MSEEVDNNNQNVGSGSGNSETRLLAETKKYLAALDEKWDPTGEEEITSDRGPYSPYIVRLKTLLRNILQPVTNTLLLRQSRFNAQLVPFLNTLVHILTHELTQIRREQQQDRQMLAQRVAEMRQENILMKQRFERVLTELLEKDAPAGDRALHIRKEIEHIWDHDYCLFESRFRGKEEEIKKRLEIYLPVFKDAGKVLDIGCGRGELLELLGKEGIEASGIDQNEDMVHICREKGLNVVQGDAFAHLQSLGEGALGGIFAAHFIEHLTLEAMEEFIKLAHSKLKQGGIIALETPNPKSIIVSSTNFYLDLSHIKPIHPEALKFLLQSRGYENPEIKYLSPFSANVMLEPIKPQEGTVSYYEVGKGVEQLNKNIKQLNELLYGYQDYAVVASKGEEKTAGN